MANNLPTNFYQGEVVNEGDSFFDSLAQTLLQLMPHDTTVTVKGLRQTCKKFAMSTLNFKEENWLQQDMANQLMKAKDKFSLHEYIPRIEFTMQDIEQGDESANILSIVEAIRGRPEVEGRIICQTYHVKLHVIVNQTTDGKQTWLHQCIDESGCRIEEPDYNDNQLVHIIDEGNSIFKPLLRSPFALKMTQFLKQCRQLNLDNLVKANRLQRDTFQIISLWPTDHLEYLCESMEKFMQQMCSECQIVQPLTSDMHFYLEEEFEFCTLLVNISSLAVECATPEEILDIVCASLEKFKHYSNEIVIKKGFSHNHFNILYFSLVAENYEKLLKLCKNVSLKVFKEIEVPLTQLLFPLIEFSRFLSIVNQLRALKINLISNVTEPVQGWSELQQQFDKLEEMKTLFNAYRFGHVQLQIVDALYEAFLKLKVEIRRVGKRDDQDIEPKSFEMYSVMKDIATLDRILKYLNAALSVTILQENPPNSNELHIGKLVLERALQVTGEYLKNEDETPHLSEKGQSKLLKAGVPIGRMSHLRNLLSHCSTIIAFIQHSDDTDITMLQNVQIDLKKIKRAIFKLLQQREFLQVKILMKDIPLHLYSSIKGYDAKEYVKQIEMCTTRDMIKEIIEKISSLAQLNSNDKFPEIVQTIQEILFMLHIKAVKNSIRHDVGKVPGTSETYQQKLHHHTALFQLTNNKNLGFLDQPDVKSSITTILNTRGIAEFYAFKLNVDKYKKGNKRPNLGETFIMNLVDKVLPKLKCSLGTSLTGKDLSKSKTGCIHTAVLKTILDNPELSDEKINNFLNELVEQSVSSDELAKLMNLPDFHNIAFLNLLQDFLHHVKCHFKSKEILDGILENVIITAQDLLLDEEVEQINMAIKDKMALNFAKTKLIALCSGIRKVSQDEFIDLVSKFQSNANEKIWNKNYFNRQRCKNQVKRVKDPYGDLLKAISMEKGFSETLEIFKAFIESLNLSKNCMQFLGQMFQNEIEKQFESHYLKNIESLRKLGLHQVTGDELKQKFCNQEILQIAIEMLVLQSLTTLKEICTPKVFYKMEKLIQISIEHISTEISTGTITSLRNYLAHGDELSDILNSKVSECVLLAAQVLAKNGSAILEIKTMMKNQESSTILEMCLSCKSETMLSSLVTNKYKRQMEVIADSDYWTDVGWRSDLHRLIANEQYTGTDICERNISEIAFKTLDQEFINAVCFNDVKMAQFCLDRGILTRIGGNSECAMHFAAENGSLDVMDLLLKHGININSIAQRNFQPLHVAVYSRQIEVVKYLLNRNANVNAKDSNHFTPLHIAAMIGSNDVIQVLIENGANVQAFSKNKMTPLQIAAWNGHNDAIVTLLKKGADVDLPDECFRTPLFLATLEGHEQIVSLLLANNASADGNTNLKLSPLCVAVMKQGCTSLAKLLIKNDANVNYTDFELETPLHYACYYKRADIVSILLQNGANANARNSKTFSPLDLATILDTTSIAEQLLEAGADIIGIDKDDWTALHFAANRGRLNMANLLIERGANVNYAGKHNVMPLHVAIEEKHYEMAKVLLQHGANAHLQYSKNKRTSEGCEENSHCYPLNAAVGMGDVQLVELLLDAGVDINKVDETKNTALHFATLAGKYLIVKLLIDKGAHIDATNSSLATPLHYAVVGGHFSVAQLLLQNGANVNVVNETKLAPLHFAASLGFCDIIELLVSHGADIYLTNEENVNALEFSVVYGQLECIKTLLELGIDVDVKGRYNQTALHIACDIECRDVAKLLSDDDTSPDKSTKLKVVQLLLQNKADVNACNSIGRTPLHYAARTGDTDVIQLLLEYHANIDVIDVNENTPLQVAEQSGYSELCKYLSANGTSEESCGSKSQLNVASVGSNTNVLPIKIQAENFQSNESNEKLHSAVQQGNLFLAKKLLSDNQYSNKVDMSDYRLLHASVINADIEIIEILLKHGANVNDADPDGGLSPLHLAVEFGYLNVAIFLIKNGADLHCLTKVKKQTPLHLAIQRERIDIIQLLVSQDNTLINETDANDDTPLTLACQITNIDIVNLLLGKGALINNANNGQDAPIHVAALKGHTSLIETLLSHAADVQAIGKGGNTPLHYCMQNGNVDIAQKLVDHGAKVNFMNKANQTPLHIAAANGNYQAVEFLLCKSAEVNGVTEDVDSPLHLAVKNGHMKVVEILAENDTNLNIKNGQSQTPLHTAAINDYYDIVELLCQKGALVDSVDANNYTPLLLAIREGHYGVVQLMLTLGADVNAICNEKFAGIHLAVLSGDSAIIAEVLSAGADVDMVGKDGWTPLHFAVSNGSLDNVMVLTQFGANVNIADIANQMPLHIACNKGYFDIVEHLIVMEANVNVSNDEGDTPLILAIKKGEARVATYLLENGANKYHPSKSGLTPFHHAILKLNGSDVIQALLKDGTDADTAAENDMSLIHFACNFGNAYAVRALTQYGLSVNARMANDVTPLHVASLKDNIQVIEVLLELGADVNAKNAANQTPLHDVILMKNTNAARVLLERGANVRILLEDDATLMHHASEVGNYEVIELLLKYGLHVDAPTSTGQTSLHTAAIHGHAMVVKELLKNGSNIAALDNAKCSPLHHACEKGHLTVVQELLHAMQGKQESIGVSTSKFPIIEMVNDENLTPLLIAIINGYEDIAITLIEMGANANLTNDNGDSPLMLALEYNRHAVAHCLIRNGADVNAANSSSHTPLHKASQANNDIMFRHLLENGANINILLNNGGTVLHHACCTGSAEIVDLLLDLGLSADAVNQAGVTPLHLASTNAHVKIVAKLLENGANPNATDHTIKTPLHFLAFGEILNGSDDNREHRTRTTEEYLQTAKLLILKGANIDATDNNNLSALHIAASRGNAQLAQLLLENKANVNGSIQDNTYTPLHYAADGGHTEMIELLLNHGAEVDQKNENESTALFLAASSGHANAARLLLLNNANANARNFHATILHGCIHGDNLEIITMILDKLRVEPQFDECINAQDSDGDTALMWAAECGHLEAAKLLLQYGASGSIKNKTGMTALDWAMKNGHCDLVTLLANH